MKRLLSLLPLLFTLTCVGAQEVLRVDFRERPPEMRAVDGLPSGPLISVLETAAHRVGVDLQWREAPFLRSLDDLRSGRVDLVPRVLLTQQRREYIHFLPSIGNQQSATERSLRRAPGGRGQTEPLRGSVRPVSWRQTRYGLFRTFRQR